MALVLEYLEEAVAEAAAANEWYAQRSAAASAGFEAELDAAELAIRELPQAWPPSNHGTRRYLLRGTSMPSAALGRNTSPAEVTNVSAHGFWLFVGMRELFVPFQQFPWFRDASIRPR